MKKFQVIVLSLITSMFLSGCMGHSHDSEGVLYRAFQDLKNDNFGDFRDHFTGECYTFASTARNFDYLRRMMNTDGSPLNTLNYDSKECSFVTGTKLPGFDEAVGTVVRQEKCDMNILSTKTGKLVLTVRTSCFYTRDPSHSGTAYYCSISKLTLWRNTPGGFRQLNLCEAK
jgi:hypothetical protein